MLVEQGHAKTAKAYILYRADRTRAREMNSTLMKIYEDLTFMSASDCDIKRENANIDGDTAMGTMLKYGSEGAKQFNEMYVLDPKHSQAHINGDIHIHDLDFLTLTTTCCQIDLLKLFHGGFSTGHGYLREPNDISSYAALACIAIQSNQNDQHGGQSVPIFDYAMAEGVKKTFRRLYTTNLAKAVSFTLGIEDYTEVLEEFKLIAGDIAKEYGISKAYVHCFMDGRDTDPKSGKGFIETLENHLKTTGGKIASIIGRYYAMDRDKRWERVKEAYDLLVEGKGKQAECMVKAMEESYAEGVTDEFIKPIVHVENGKPVAVIEEGDVVIFFNYRNDRAKELTVVLTQQDMPEAGMHTIPGLQYFCMTPYDASFKGVHILFDKENVNNTLGEFLANVGKTQLHIAETEKYAHVTFFFNGGRETPFDSEERILVPSPKVATYDLKPEMSAFEVKDKLVDAINTKKFDFIVVNYANGDMVGHTGVYKAIEKAVVTIDACLHDTVEAAKANDYEVIIIADHGNADHALNEDGTPNTAHSLNPVPFVYVTANKDAKVEDGILADVAPSILHILGLKQPKEMTGKSLIK